MTRHSDYTVSFAGAVAVHAAVAAFAVSFLSMKTANMIPRDGNKIAGVNLMIIKQQAQVPDHVKPEKPDSVETDPPPPEPAVNTGGESDFDAEITSVDVGRTKIEPGYPLGSRLRGEEGVVKLTVNIGADGRTLKAAVSSSSGYHMLDKSAIEAVKRAQFYNVDGTLARETTITISIRFQLKK